MKSPITGNRFIDALLKMLLLAAVIHTVILVIRAIQEKTMVHLNFFRILSLDSFFPVLTRHLVFDILSIVIMATSYVVIFFYFTRKKGSVAGT
jgi:dolichyl-phosphate-mannose--protein O-mannosyl transferase